MDLHEIFTEAWQWAIEQMIKFWLRSGLRIRIATLVRCVLAEVCTVPASASSFDLHTVNCLTVGNIRWKSDSTSFLIVKCVTYCLTTRQQVLAHIPCH